VELSWLSEPTVDALRAGLRRVAPDLAEATIVPRGLEPSGDPQYCKASAGGRRPVRGEVRLGRTVLVHGDFNGDNHLWDEETLRLRLVIDLETVGTGEPEFDLRCLPGDCGIDLFTASVAHYEKLTGTKLDVDRIMAWHLRTVLGDALWRAEAGIPLPDKRTPVQWVDDLTARFTVLGTFD
jgi:hypothetical protein